MPPLTPEALDTLNHKNTQADIQGVWMTIMIWGVANLLVLLYVVDQLKAMKDSKAQFKPYMTEQQTKQVIERIDNGPKPNMDGHDSSPPQQTNSPR